MKKLALIVAASVLSTVAHAETTVIHRDDGITGSRTIVRHRSVDLDDADTVVHKRVVTTGSVGCKTKTTAKTDEFGDTTVKKKTKC